MCNFVLFYFCGKHYDDEEKRYIDTLGMLSSIASRIIFPSFLLMLYKFSQSFRVISCFKGIFHSSSANSLKNSALEKQFV